ncbi:MAG TPA: SpoIIE family protein phosphatase [Streptosporangiaceae bacterium]|nr:SpoIIE family protein phosphatase [Streptosporangiaceae bacterium]
MTANDDEHVARLSALVARQRQEIDGLRQQAAARSIIDLARGILMERLGCSAAAAASQLAKIAADSRTPLAELAAEIAGERAVPAGTSAGVSPAPWAGSVVLAGAAMELSADGSGLAAAMLSESLAAEGAVAVAIWLVSLDGAIELAGEAGFGPGEASRWQRMPPGTGAPGERSARTAAELWWPAGRPPGAAMPVIGRWPEGARAVVPVLTENARCIGALEICWPAVLGGFPHPLRRQIRALAKLTAQALTTDSGVAVADQRTSWVLDLLEGLHESILFALPIRADDGAVTDFRIIRVSEAFRDPAGRSPADLAGQSLIEAYPAAAMPGGLLEHAVQVARTGIAQHISGGLITGIASVRIARLADGIAISPRHAAEADRLATLLEHAQRLGRFGGWEENLAAGTVHWSRAMFPLFGVPDDQPVRLSQLHSSVISDDAATVEAFRTRLLRDKVATAAIFRVVRRDDASVRQVRAFAEPVTDHYGKLVAVRGAYQDVSAHYHTELALAATRDLLSDTEERRAEEHRLALRLQQAITPQSSRLVEAAGLEVAARYRPAGAAHLVSGDWYDTVMLPSKQVMLAVGDVAGHGIDAVTGMVALRNCLRGLTITGAGPACLLTWLNGAACHLTDDILGTAICGLYDPADGMLRWARAGHLPAVLVRDAKAELLPQPQGVLLGVDPQASFSEATMPLRLGDTLLLFTDGLIERRNASIDECLDDMLKVASRPVTDLDDYADLLAAQAGSDTGDDACLVAVTLRLFPGRAAL